ncbi:macro domain-containing protein [Microbulbifer epialgicus]|uniref:Macro domain-containing protein n=1 Tax=Microbulbifer epialgicus TaxID=393907 RepID=A0ABV4NYS8_9GAMM
MKIIFRDTNPKLVAEIVSKFQDVPELTAECVSIFAGSMKADAIISPANCIGRMDGGIDGLYVHHFGWGLQVNLSNLLSEKHGGRLEIGRAVSVPTGCSLIPLMISAPTMDWPPGDVSNTENCFLAFRAALLLAQSLRLKSIFTPGLGTLTGRMHPRECAKQMRAAWDDYIEIPF